MSGDIAIHLRHSVTETGGVDAAPAILLQAANEIEVLRARIAELEEALSNEKWAYENAQSDLMDRDT